MFAYNPSYKGTNHSALVWVSWDMVSLHHLSY